MIPTKILIDDLVSELTDIINAVNSLTEKLCDIQAGVDLLQYEF